MPNSNQSFQTWLRSQKLVRPATYVALALLYLAVSWTEPVLGILEFLFVTALAVTRVDT